MQLTNWKSYDVRPLKLNTYLYGFLLICIALNVCFIVCTLQLCQGGGIKKKIKLILSKPSLRDHKIYNIIRIRLGLGLKSFFFQAPA